MNEQYVTLVGKVCAPRYEEVYTPEVKSKLPIEASSEGRNLKDYTIYGNNNPNHVDENQSTLPVSIDTYGGNAVDWEIYGNNNPVVENKTGTLPINASATAGNLLDWTINGNNNSGKNVVQLGESQTVNGVTLTIDSQAGTVIMNGDTTSAEAGFSVNLFDTSSLVGGDYIFSGGADGGSSTTYDLYLYNRTDQVYVGRLYNSSDIISATIESGKRYTVYVQCRKGQVYDNIVFKPMLRPANTTSTFEPYTVGVGERTKNLISVSNVTADTGITIVDADEATGSLKLSSSLQYRGGRFDFNFEDGKMYTISVINNIATSNARIAFRQVGTNTIVSSVSLGTAGVKTAKLTFSSTDYPNGVYVSLICNMSADGVTRTIDLSNLMLVEGSSMLTDFIPYGYKIPMQAKQRTKNIFEIIPSAQIITETGTLIFATDAERGTITANGTAGSAEAFVKQRFIVTSELAGDYYFSGSFNQTGSSSTFNAYMYDNTARAFIRKWDGTTQSPTIKGTESQEVKLIEGHTVELTIRVFATTSVDNLVFKPMIRKADTSSDFEPYYNINQTDIYIGNSPLTQGQSITKAQSGQDITLFSGDNIIDTSLYNKPSTSITYNSSVLGVGQHNINLFNATIEQGGINSGAEYNSNTRIRTTFMSNMLDAGTYTINASGVINTAVRYLVVTNYFDDNKTYTGGVTTWKALPFTFNLANRCYVRFAFRASDPQDVTPSDISNIMLVRGSTAPTTYVAYGYELPITVTDSSNNSTPYTFQLGSQPLAQGQSISKSSIGTDIVLLSGTNTISTILGNKPEMKIDYLSTEVGVGERTENLFDASKFAGGQTHYEHSGLSFDISNQTVTVNGTSTATYPQVYLESADDNYLQLEELETYTISLYKENVPEGSLIYLNLRARYNGGNEQVFDRIDDTKTITIPSGWTEWRQLLVLAREGLTYVNCKIRIDIVKGSTAPSTYEPYGYKIPIDIKQDDEVVDHKDIYIGTQPLEEGASVSKVSVGQDITLVSGNNYIDTDLFNKPEMYIK